MHDSKRRRLLKSGLAAASLFLPASHALVWAQSEGTLKLVRLPKVALVVGNSQYRRVPALRNSGNDARAIGAALEKLGFQVTVKLDASRAEMNEAMQAYAKLLADRKCVGLFYFAGHGLQLAWRNYLLPVEAAVAKVDDIAAQGVDVGVLIDGIKRAGNPMNVIILDACRDNPFADDFRVEQKGLSQMDAPQATLLAYATSPGNTASDGAGSNGLYTENLLREMTVREAKIEDVFKRVRLGVRRESHGRQIPWESTSLEEDFYFLPPEQLRKRSEEEEERHYQEELGLFEKAKDATTPAPIEDYLRRHPSGQFADLAQLQLDKVLADQGEKPIEIAPAQGNPNTAGTARADTRYRVGDQYVYDVLDRVRDVRRKQITTVTAITGNEVVFNKGRLVLDLLGNIVHLGDGRRFTPRQDQPLEYTVGRKWTTRFGVRKGEKESGITTLQFKVAARETITVPAGTFDCFRVEGIGRNDHFGRASSEVRLTYWSAPGQVRRPIAREELRRVVARGQEKRHVSERAELVSYRQS